MKFSLNGWQRWSLVATVIVLLLALGGYFVYQYYDQASKKVDKDVLAVVGNTTITRNNLNDAVYGLTFDNTKTATLQQKKDLLSALVKDQVYREAATRLGLSVTDSQVKAEALNSAPEIDKYSDRQKTLVLNNTKTKMLKDLVLAKVITNYQGEYLEVRYNKYNSEGTTAQQQTLKAAVQPVAEDYYDRLKSGQITFDAAAQAILTDKTVDIASYGGLYDHEGGSFDSSSFIASLPDFVSNVESMKVGEMKFFSVADKTVNPTSGKIEYKDGSFIIAKLTNINKGEARSEDQWLKDQNTKLEVKVYYENIV